VVLDLGLSSGPSVPGQIIEEGIAGTPAYLSPEQLMGERATPKSDLYAIGVMLHEALSGVMPQPSHSLEALVDARLNQEAPSLRQRGIDPSTCAVEVIDALLAREPLDRPPSAAHVAAKLRGEFPPLELLRNHPVLQLDDTVDALTEAAQHLPEVTFYGPLRSGRSRCLRRVASRLRRAGKSVHWLDRQVAGRSQLGDVVIVDGADTPVGPGPSCIIRVVEHPEPDSIRIRPLERDALKALFRGSDRIFHLREDSARELYRRTKGWQLRIIEELSAWLRAGLARVEERALVIDRDALDLLASGFRVCPIPAEPEQRDDPMLAVLAAAGPALDQQSLATATRRSPGEVAASLAVLVREGKVDETIDGLYQTTSDSMVFPRPEDHAAVARGLAPGTRGRLQHLVAADAVEEIAVEARRSSIQFMQDAMVGRARATATEGLASVRGLELGPTHELALLSALLLIAEAEGTERSFELALYEIGRATFQSPELVRLDRLARVALLALRRDADRALALADALGPFKDMELEQFRQAARAMAARSGRRDRSEEVLRSVESWATNNNARAIHGKLITWKGWALYIQSHFKEAVAKHEEAIQWAPDVRTRLSALLSLAETSIEAGYYERACELARDAMTASASSRHSFYEARAEAVLRYAAYRSGSAERADLELIDALPGLHVSNVEAQINLNEGAVAWRAGDTATARTLVRTAHRLWRAIGHLWGTVLTQAFLAVLDEGVSAHKIEDQAHDCPLPGVALQTFAMLGRAHPERTASFIDHAHRLAEQIAPEYRPLRREVLSVEECLQWLEPERKV